MAGKSPTNIVGAKKAPVGQDDRLVKWQKERNRPGINWSDVSACTLRSVISVCVQEGYHLTFAPAAGGLGCCIKLWNGGKDVKEYALDAPEVQELLDGLIDALGSSSEDVRQIYATGAD